jgi:Flp pilus assembly protein protease CpaA
MEILFLIVLVALVIGTYTDFKTREVPDWVNKGLISLGIGINLIFSFVYWDFQFIINSLVGFGVFFGLALLTYYTGQWGGGDSKMIMGIGAMIGIDVFAVRDSFLLGFLFNILVVGAFYGLLWSFFLSVKKFKPLVKDMKKSFSSKGMIRAKKGIVIASLVIILLSFLIEDLGVRLSGFVLALLLISMYYIWVYIKSVENVCMLKYVPPSLLTEGDWIAKDIVVGGKFISGPKDLGIEQKKINELKRLFSKGKVGKILVKEGIPFVPSFLIAYVVSWIYGNLLFVVFG